MTGDNTGAWNVTNETGKQSDFSLWTHYSYWLAHILVNKKENVYCQLLNKNKHIALETEHDIQMLYYLEFLLVSHSITHYHTNEVKAEENG